MAADASIAIALKFLDQASAPMQHALDKIATSTKAMETVTSSALGLVRKGFAAIAAELTISKALSIGKEYEQAMVRIKNVFQGEAEAAVASLEMISDRSKKLFDFAELARGAAKIKDTMDLFDLSAQDMAVFLTRTTDIAKAKGFELEEAITKVNNALMGAAKSGRQVGVVLTETYMQYESFNGKLKDIWNTLSDSDKAWWRLQEFLQQSGKYAGAAAKESTTLGGSLTALGNTIKDRLEPALAAACGWLAKYVNLARQAIAPESLASQVLQKTESIRKAKSVGEPGPGGELGMDSALKTILGNVPGMDAATAAIRTDLLSLRARLRGERAERETLQPAGLSAEGLPKGWEAHTEAVKGTDKATKAAGDTMRDYQRILDEGQRITQSTWTETEKYNAELEKLNYYLGYGAISQSTYERAVQSTWEQLVKAAEATESWQGHLKVVEEGGGVFKQTRTQAELYASEIDRLNYLLGYGVINQDTYNRAVEAAGTKFKDTTDEMSQFAIQAARNIQDALGDQLYNMMTGKFDDIGSSFGQLLARMASQAAAAQIGQALFGDFGTDKKLGGLAGTLISGISGMFAGGGQAESGKAYVVGEKGPELFLPTSGGTVIPNSKVTVGSSRAPSVTVNVTNETGQQVEAKTDSVKWDGEGYHAAVSLKLVKNNPQYRNALKGLLMGR